MEKLRCLGGSPPFYKVGRRILYDRAELDAWARLKRFTSTTSEAA
jgi:hypothetical protein